MMMIIAAVMVMMMTAVVMIPKMVPVAALKVMPEGMERVIQMKV